MLFKNTNFDFLGKKWPFIMASLVLTAAGLGSLAVKGGPHYGIDFRGGVNMYVKFAEAPPVDKIRSALSQKIAGEISVVGEPAALPGARDGEAEPGRVDLLSHALSSPRSRRCGRCPC